MKVKKDLFKLNLADIDLGNTKIYINQSLCLYYKLLCSKSKRLHATKQIHSYYEENSRTLWTMHVTHFDKRFHGIDLSPLS